MRNRVYLIALGLLSLGFYLWMWKISYQFNWGGGYRGRPILTYVFIYLAIFIFYGLGLLLIWKKPADRFSFWTIIVFGLLFRFALLPSQQIQEDDVYRYLWDGKVFGQGINPYKYAPSEINSLKELEIKNPDQFKDTYSPKDIEELNRLYKLKWENDRALIFLERVNHPEIPTVYPPLSQYVFRAVYHLAPDNITALRTAFLLFDLLAAAFIILTLDKLKINRGFSLAYFWSPLLIKETFNSTHLDIIGISFLCVSIYFLVSNRHLAAVFFLALSVLGKLYPVILFPLYLKQTVLTEKSNEKPLWKLPALACLIFVATITILYLPFLSIGGKAFAGLKTFGTYWQSNDSIFALLVYFYRDLLGFASESQVLFSYDLPSLLAKITVAVALVGALVYLLIKTQIENNGLRNLFIILALVFLLSPVQNPWYLCWIVPFLCIFPWRSWVLLTGLVGLYYLDFYFDYQELPQYTPWLVWVEFLPFYLALGWEWKRKKVEIV